MREKLYNRNAAVDYARRWALHRNPTYYDFENLGGDCTNFASQCIFAGSGIMNHTPVTGWFFNSLGSRSPSWTGVEYLYNFLTNNRSVGPYGHEASEGEVSVGDIVQLGRNNGHFYHSPVITAVYPKILVAAHTFDALDRPLDSYIYDKARFIRIDGVRVW